MKKAAGRLNLIWLGLWALASLLTLMFGRGMESHHLSTTLNGPSFFHPLGHDAFGRDLLGLLLHASGRSGLFAAGITVTSALLGVILGGALAISPRWLSFPLVRLIEFLLAFPFLILALAWAAISGPGWDTLFASLAIGILPGFIRLMYLRAKEILSEEYVLAARSCGAGPGRLLFHHLRPALTDLAAVKIPNLFAGSLLAEATLSFLGVGAPIGSETWGTLLAQGKDYLIEAPHVAIATGLPLFLTALALQSLSERRARV